MADVNTLSRARASTSDPQPRPKEDGAKRRQVLEGARKVFLADGFDGASMNEIARVAGVSKGTLYVYFTSKEELFAALIREEKREQAEQLCRLDAEDGDLHGTLMRLGVRLLDLVLRPSSIAHFRTVLAVASKFPTIGRAFYEAGPEFGRKRLAAHLDAQVEAGVIETDDTEAAAVHFIEMCKSPYLLRAILGVGARPSEAEIQAHVARVVDVFLRAYAKRTL